MSLIRSGALALVLALVCGVTVQAQAMDFAKMVQAPPVMVVGEGAKVGYRIEMRTKAGDMMTTHFVAIVGETDDAWEIESDQATIGYASLPEGKGLALALVVDKETGEVLQAKLGKSGEVAQEVKIMKGPKSFQRGSPTGEVEYTLPSGKKIKATKYVNTYGAQTFTTLVGLKGTEFEGVTLESKGPGMDRKLSEDPSEIDYELRDKDAEGKPKTVVARQMTYSDQSVVVMTKDPVVKSLVSGVLANRMKAATFEIVSVRTDAKKTLSWN